MYHIQVIQGRHWSIWYLPYTDKGFITLSGSL